MACSPERYLLFLSENISKDARTYLAECVEKHGLTVEEENCPDQDVLVVGAPFSQLAEEVGVTMFVSWIFCIYVQSNLALKCFLLLVSRI